MKNNYTQIYDVCKPSLLLSARYMPAEMPMGMEMMPDSNMSTREPTIALNIPPPFSPIGLCISVKKPQFITDDTIFYNVEEDKKKR